MRFKEGMEEVFFQKETEELMCDAYRRLKYTAVVSELSAKFPGVSLTHYGQFQKKYNELRECALLPGELIVEVFDSQTGATSLKFVQDMSKQNHKSFKIVRVGNCMVYVPEPDRYFIDEGRDEYEDQTIGKLLSSGVQFSDDEKKMAVQLEAGMSGATMKTLKVAQSGLMAEVYEMEQEVRSIERATHGEFAELNRQMAVLQEEIEKKKSLMLKDMDKLKAELEEKQKGLSKKIAVLDAQIFDIRSYLGESYDFIKVRSGLSADPSEPLIINQKLRYLNEDLPLLVGLYSELVNMQSLVEVFQHSEQVVEYFSGSEKSITFFRLAKNRDVSTGYKHKDNGAGYEWVVPIIESKGYFFTGFLCRDGGNVYLGFVDEGERIEIDENLFMDLHRAEEIVDEELTDRAVKKRATETLARKFVFSMIQGMIDNTKLIQFDEEVSIFRGSNKVVFSSASGRIGTSIYGSYLDLQKRFSAMTRLGDKIWVTDNQKGRERMAAYYSYSEGFLDTGLNEISLVNYDEFGEATHFTRGTRTAVASYEDVSANISVFDGEMVNLSYLNSVWVKYFISNKSGNSNSIQTSAFYEMAPHWVGMLREIEKREGQEREVLLRYIPELDQLESWQVTLSEWRMVQKNPVRVITDYQAKRFAKALRSGFKGPKWLYDKESLGAIEKVIELELMGKAFSSVVEKIEGKSNKDFYWSEFMDKQDIRGAFIEKQKQMVADLRTEIQRIEIEYGINVIGSRGEIEVLLGSVLEAIDSENLRDVDLVGKVMSYESEIEGLIMSGESRFLRLARLGRIQNMQSKRAEINALRKKYPNSVQVLMEHELGKRYYPNLVFFDPEKIPVVILFAAYVLLRNRYFKAMSKVNGYPYYRLIKEAKRAQ